jgi:hypothetical protein
MINYIIFINEGDNSKLDFSFNFEYRGGNRSN